MTLRVRLKGELSSDDLLTCVLGVLRVERDAGVVEPFLALALRAADLWSPVSHVPAQLARLAECATALAEDPEHRAPALRILAASAGSGDDFALLADAAADDTDLAWRTLTRRAALGDHDPDAVEALLERDPDPDAAARALAVTAARPDEAAKQEAWEALFEARTVPSGLPTITLAAAFWRPVQHDLLLPFAHRYVDEAIRLARGGMLANGSLLRLTFPTVGDEALLARCRSVAGESGQEPSVRATLLTGGDNLTRMLRSRS